MLGMEPEVPLSADKHVQLDQLRNLKKKRVLTFSNDDPPRREETPFGMSTLGIDASSVSARRPVPHKIPKMPYKVRNRSERLCLERGI